MVEVDRAMSCAGLLLWTVTACACQAGGASEESAATHPRLAQLEPTEPTPGHVRLEAGSPRADIITPSILAPGPQPVRLGALANPEEQVFGRIAGAILGPFGRVLILDSLDPSIKVFDPGSGRRVATVGRGGLGPGEFQDPQAMFVGPSDALFVLNALRRISIFRLGRDSIAFEGTRDVDLELIDGCVAGDDLVIHGVVPGVEESAGPSASSSPSVPRPVRSEARSRKRAGIPQGTRGGASARNSSRSSATRPSLITNRTSW